MRNKHLFCRNYFKEHPFREIELPQDASMRKYSRIITDDKSYILMDCPPTVESIRPFVDMTKFLLENEFSAPIIYAADYENGFLLLEDFGDCHLRKYLTQTVNSYELVKTTYCLIIDLLIAIQNKESPHDLKKYDIEIIIDELSLLTDYYIPLVTRQELSVDEKKQFMSLWRDVLTNSLPKLPDVTILKDYHVENMLLLPRDGIKSIGLLDFQDAVVGNPTYDLSALLTDARIDVPVQLANECLEHYISKNNQLAANDIIQSYHILTVTNNSRILGVFARQKLKYNNPHYMQYIPRVLGYIKNSLEHPSLAKIKEWYQKIVL